MIVFSYGTTNFTHELSAAIRSRARRARTGRCVRPTTRPVPARSKSRAAMHRRGMPVTYLNREQLREMTGTDRYIGAMLDARGAICIRSATPAVSRVRRLGGAKVHGETPALSLRREGSRWRIETPRAVVHADKVLLATNGFTDDSGRRSAAPSCRCLLDRRHGRSPTRWPAPSCRRVPCSTRAVTSRSITASIRTTSVDGRPRPMRWIKSPHDVAYLSVCEGYGRSSGASLDARLEQPLAITGDHYPMCMSGRNILISPAATPRRRARDRDGGRAGATADRGAKAEIDCPSQASSRSRCMRSGRWA
nr:FAD-binding oxidoreductase [Bradyrhizobium symbiodeficiens]